jgi:methylmalonyl-CoA/ethylmalonyl-CoA epimerase
VVNGGGLAAVPGLDSFGLGAIDQISFVVRNVDAAIPFYSQLFGPFRVMTTSALQTSFRGRPMELYLKLAFAQSAVEIELVEVIEGESPHSEHLERHGEGLQHVRFNVPDIATTQRAMEEAGFVTVFEGTAPTSTFSYLEQPAEMGYTMVELLERHPAVSAGE